MIVPGWPFILSLIAADIAFYVFRDVRRTRRHKKELAVAKRIALRFALDEYESWRKASPDSDIALGGMAAAANIAALIATGRVFTSSTKTIEPPQPAAEESSCPTLQK